MRKIHLGFVTQYFSPEGAAIGNSLARNVVGREIGTIEVLTGFPNYPTGILYDGYRQRFGFYEKIDDLPVYRTLLYPYHGQSAFKRMLNYLSFGLSSLFFPKFGKRADVIYVYATQMTAAIGPYFWRLLFGTPYVLHVQDLWPESITGSGLVGNSLVNRATAAILRPFLAEAYRRAEGVIAIAPTMARLLEERGVSSEKMHVVYNWSVGDTLEPTKEDNEIFKSLAINRHDPKRAGLRFVYAGNFGPLQDLELVIRSFGKSARGKGKLYLFGGGVAELELRQVVKELALEDDVIFGGQVPATVIELVRDATDFYIISLKNLDIFRGTIPSKFQKALGQGIPVITTVPGDVQALVRDYQLGFAAESEDEDSLSEAFTKALATTSDSRGEMGKRARALYLSKMDMMESILQIRNILIDAARKKHA